MEPSKGFADVFHVQRHDIPHITEKLLEGQSLWSVSGVRKETCTNRSEAHSTKISNLTSNQRYFASILIERRVALERGTVCHSIPQRYCENIEH